MNSEGEDGENNRLTVDYSVVLANIMNNVDKSQNYYVSSGVVIGDYYNEVTCCVLEVMSNLFPPQPEYVWVSQETLTTSPTVETVTTYDLLMTTNIDNTSPWEMKPMETFFFEAYIISTNPQTNLEFEIGELRGDVDAFHIGKPAVTFGSAFRFTDRYIQR